MSELQYITLQAWAEERYPGRVPHRNTLHRWAQNGMIVPAPFKLVNRYFVHPGAIYCTEHIEPPVALPVATVAQAIAEDKRLKKVTKLYRHFDADGRLLYIGISLSPIARLRRHATGSHWSHDIARVEIASYPTRAKALSAEKAAIKAEAPLHNIAHSRKVV